MTLVIEGYMENKVVIGFINSSGDLEYTMYHRGDGGVISGAFDEITVAKALVVEVGIDSYASYEIEDPKW